jgi:hypothetical protein
MSGAKGRVNIVAAAVSAVSEYRPSVSRQHAGEGGHAQLRQCIRPISPHVCCLLYQLDDWRANEAQLARVLTALADLEAQAPMLRAAAEPGRDGRSHGVSRRML